LSKECRADKIALRELVAFRSQSMEVASVPTTESSEGFRPIIYLSGGDDEQNIFSEKPFNSHLGFLRAYDGG
jgi:hypothetical protein